MIETKISRCDGGGKRRRNSPVQHPNEIIWDYTARSPPFQSARCPSSSHVSSLEGWTHGDDSDQPLVGLLQPKGERDQEDDDGVEGLEHLDKGHAQAVYTGFRET